MDLRAKRLEEYVISQLFPINFIEENKRKRLSLSLNLFKICKNFPKEEIGKMKKIQKDLEKPELCNLLFAQEWDQLTEDQKETVTLVSSKRASTPSRTSPYVKFIVKSILKTYDCKIKIASFKEEIYESWIFEKDSVKFDLTTNSEKLMINNCLFVDASLILDENRLIKKNFVYDVAALLIPNYNKTLVDEMNVCLNKIVDNHNALYNQQSSVINIHLKEEVDKLVYTRT